LAHVRNKIGSKVLLMPHHCNPVRRALMGAAVVLSACALPALAQAKILLRISTPAVPDAWHAKMWTVFKDTLEKERTR
jgi:hypothetical protein